MKTIPTYASPGQMEEPYYSLKVSSANYWAAHTGVRDCAPAPSYRTIKGKQVLGRYLDPFGCQACMTWSRQSYQDVLKRTLAVMAVLGLVSLLDIVFLAVVLPLFLLGLWYQRGQYAKHYDVYYQASQEIVRTGQPVWVPFDKVRLHFIKYNPNSIWP